MPSLAAARSYNTAWKPAYVPVGIFVGGTSGIGAGFAQAFARHTDGAAHIILVGRNESAASLILSQLTSPPGGTEYTRQFISCDLTRLVNVKRTCAGLLARFERVNFLVITAGAISLAGPTLTEEGVDAQMSLLYYSKWAFISELLPCLRAARDKGQDARVAAVHTAGRGGPIDTQDLGLQKTMAGGLRNMGKLVAQVASYHDAMAESFGAQPANHSITFTHTFPGTVDTPLLRASPSRFLRIIYPIRYLVFPTLMWRAMSIEQCGEFQLYGLLKAPPGYSRFGGEGDDIGLYGRGNPDWAIATEALQAHSENIVGGVSA